jgi:hypothetical protein
MQGGARLLAWEAKLCPTRAGLPALVWSERRVHLRADACYVGRRASVSARIPETPARDDTRSSRPGRTWLPQCPAETGVTQPGTLTSQCRPKRPSARRARRRSEHAKRSSHTRARHRDRRASASLRMQHPVFPGATVWRMNSSSISATLSDDVRPTATSPPPSGSGCSRRRCMFGTGQDAAGSSVVRRCTQTQERGMPGVVLP